MELVEIVCLFVKNRVFLFSKSLLSLRFVTSRRRLLLSSVQSISGYFVKLLEQILGFSRKFIRHLYHKRNIMVSTHILISKRRYSFAFKSNFGICLRSRFYIIDNFTVNCINHDLAAQCSDCKREWNRRVNIGILSLENRMTSYYNFYKQIASWSAVCSRLAFITDSYALSVINTCRNGYLNFFLIGNITCSAAVQYLLERPVRADIAFIYGSVADKYGNVKIHGTARTFNTVMATAADTVICQADEVVEMIDPDEVLIQGVLVDYIVGGKN